MTITASRYQAAALYVPRWLLNHPIAALVAEFSLVGVHCLLTAKFGHSPFQRLVADEGAARALYLGVASAGAPLAGFAGVVVVFALGDRRQFKVFRERGGRRLEITWATLFLFPFTAVFAGLIAAVVTALGGAFWAPFLAEFALVLLADTLLRGAWLIRTLIAIVTANDLQTSYEGNRTSWDRLRMDPVA